MSSKLLCNKFEPRFAATILLLFILITSFLTLFGFSPILNSSFTSSFYVILIAGIILAISTINKIGIKNFAGRSVMYFLIATILTLINTVSINLNLDFKLNELVWFIVSLLLITGLLISLNVYKLNIPKNSIVEASLLFILSIITLSFFGGWPQIINSLLITTAIMALRVSGKKTNCGVVFISTGLIILAISNILFIQRYWSGINYFGDVSDLSLLLSWFSIVTGIYFIKRNYA